MNKEKLIYWQRNKNIFEKLELLGLLKLNCLSDVEECKTSQENSDERDSAGHFKTKMVSKLDQFATDLM